MGRRRGGVKDLQVLRRLLDSMGAVDETGGSAALVSAGGGPAAVRRGLFEGWSGRAVAGSAVAEGARWPGGPWRPGPGSDPARPPGRVGITGADHSVESASPRHRGRSPVMSTVTWAGITLRAR